MVRTAMVIIIGLTLATIWFYITGLIADDIVNRTLLILVGGALIPLIIAVILLIWINKKLDKKTSDGQKPIERS